MSHISPSDPSGIGSTTLPPALEIQQLCKALTEAFTRDELDTLVGSTFSVRLETIAAPANLEATVHELVQWARRRRILDRLIAAAREARPHHHVLASLLLSESTLWNLELSIAALPTTHGRTFGRDSEKQVLTRCWEEKKVRVVAVVGLGGCGKSQLVRAWLADLGAQYAGAERVFGWSFYAQGTEPRAVVSSDEFFRRAFVFFGGLPPAGEDDAFGRAQELARRIRARRTLLVLDGLEPCQDTVRGELRDRPLKYLIKELVAAMNGLCVITTRPPFTELDALDGDAFERVELRGLDRASGIAALRDAGVRGSDVALEGEVDYLQGHALSLAVLGRFVREVGQGDLHRARVEASELAEEAPLERLLASYDRSLDGARRELLLALGLFDRPASLAELHRVRAGRVVPGMNDEKQWNRARQNLIDSALLSHDEASDTLDMHPVIRAHYARAFLAADAAAFHAAHGRLFEYFRDGAPEHPSTLAEMGRLYRAVTHGCQARRWADAFDVLHRRIRQGEEHVSLKKFGAVSADLAAYACFFSPTWTLIAELSSWQGYWLKNSAGVLLRAEGDFDESRALLTAAVRSAEAQGRLDLAAESARNLASTESAMGRLRDALATVEDAVRFADTASDLRTRIVSRDFHAHLLNRLGRLAASRALFEEVERMRVEEDTTGALRQFPEASFAALLVELGEPELAARRARRALELTRNADSEGGSLLNIGLSMRSLARALAAAGETEDAASMFDEAMAHLRRAARLDHIAPGLVDRARFLLARDPTQAARDLDEALTIAAGRGFRLVEADVHLTRARLAVLAQDMTLAESSLQRSRALLTETGFELRMPMQWLTEAVVHAARGRREAAAQAIFAAKQRIDEMGMHGIRSELERVTRIVESE